MTAEGQQELEFPGAKFRRNLITLPTSARYQGRVCFRTAGGEAGGGRIPQRRKILAVLDVGMENWLFLLSLRA